MKYQLTTKNIILSLIGVIIFGIILYNYIKSLKEDYYINGIDDLVYVPADGDIPDRITLPQAWADSTRTKFWYTSQGSEIMPYDWFTWLEQSTNDTLFRNSTFMESLGYLPSATSPNNPSGLPIGFAVTRARNNKERGFGFTCSACHTSQIDYNGTKLLVEGAPTLANFVKFYGEIVKSLTATHRDDAKFDRFAKQVLKDNYNASAAEDLREQVQKAAMSTAERQAVNALPSHYPEDFTSYARLDAFGNIANAGSAFALHDLSNKNAPTAPVSYPFLWGTHQSDVVQWNASAANTPVVGPLLRNVGEVVGVFGDLSIHSAPWWQQLIGIKVAYSSTVDFEGLGELESMVMDLRSPAWPDKYFPPYDIAKAANGSIIFNKQCASCHQVIPRDKEGNPYKANRTLVSKLQTDPTMALNSANNTAKTLILDGIKKVILVGDTFQLESSAISIPVNGVVGVILKRPITAMKAGLIPGKNEGIKADEDNLKKQLTEHLVKTEQPPKDSLVYKGRPLNGIWATAPFLHNGSVPNLWELLLAPEDRTKEFYVGSREFDPVNVGFVTDQGPSLFKVLQPDGSIMPGNSNLGHSYGTGLTDSEKWDLIEYMKSL